MYVYSHSPTTVVHIYLQTRYYFSMKAPLAWSKIVDRCVYNNMADLNCVSLSYLLLLLTHPSFPVSNPSPQHCWVTTLVRWWSLDQTCSHLCTSEHAVWTCLWSDSSDRIQMNCCSFDVEINFVAFREKTFCVFGRFLGTKLDYDHIKSTHFTNCQKPWTCIEVGGSNKEVGA